MRAIVLPCLFLLLSACGGASRERLAADACMSEINKRLAGKNIDVDVRQLAASATVSADDTLQIAGPIVFDRGLGSEYAQTIDCRVRLDANVPSVIFLQFNWSMDDLKKADRPNR
jgi:hypothetical protein